MATLVELAVQGKVFKLDPQLDAGQQEFRQIYTSERLKRFIEDELPNLGSTWNLEASPLEQLDALVEVFASGDTLTYRWQFSPLRSVQDGVWELKTADVRIFGWFVVRDCFVGVAGNLAEIVKSHGLYHGYGGEVIRFRDNLDLDQPKFVSGTDPNNVVSNYSYP